VGPSLVQVNSLYDAINNKAIQGNSKQEISRFVLTILYKMTWKVGGFGSMQETKGGISCGKRQGRDPTHYTVYGV
jgi:hypothetical protein